MPVNFVCGRHWKGIGLVRGRKRAGRGRVGHSLILKMRDRSFFSHFCSLALFERAIALSLFLKERSLFHLLQRAMKRAIEPAIPQSLF